LPTQSWHDLLTTPATRAGKARAVMPTPPSPPKRHLPADGPISAGESRFSAHRADEKWDARIARLAVKQHGLVSLRQLNSLGLAERTVQDREAAGRLHRVHQVDMCVLAGLPEPEVNVRIDIGDRLLEPDFLWRDPGLIIEADSRRYHDTDSAFQIDRKRDQRLMLAGWQVARCTWEQVEHEPRQLAETIRRLLEQIALKPKGRKPRPVRGNRPIGD
jgi:Protein of unknown function (DUF559)